MRLASYIEQINRFAYLGATSAQPVSFLESAPRVPTLACKMNVKYGSWNPAGIPADSRKSPGFSQVPHNFVRF